VKKLSVALTVVENGKKLYKSYGCYECHGYAAQGGLAGPRIGPNAVPYEAFFDYVRHPGGSMPPYTAKVASNQELADIYAYIVSLPKPPDAKSVPLLNQ
jgi:mono/diheme cytochrome c family protein